MKIFVVRCSMEVEYLVAADDVEDAESAGYELIRDEMIDWNVDVHDTFKFLDISGIKKYKIPNVDCVVIDGEVHNPDDVSWRDEVEEEIKVKASELLNLKLPLCE